MGMGTAGIPRESQPSDSKEKHFVIRSAKCVVTLYRVGQKREATNELMAIILSDLNRFTNLSTGRFLGECAVNWLLTIPPLFAYVAYYLVKR